MDDQAALVEDLLCQCLQARGAGDAAAIERLLADQPADVRELVTSMLGTLDRVGLGGEATPTPTDTRATPFGPYLLLQRLGAGTMGVVYRARDAGGTERALKLLQPGLLPVRRARLRFEREIQALRELDHPGICPILDAGEVDGVPFLVMPLLVGESLQARFARGPARGDVAHVQLLEIVEQVALALHHAHERGFVHRDVKPANVLVRTDGGPVVLDFGLARLDRDDAATLSQSHEVIGAPAYMAPEQIADGRAVDRRCDVYALGVLLYEGLTGRCPYEAATRESLYRRILTGELTPPSHRTSDVPAPLDVVCLTALARESNRRYQTAADLAADLARVRAGQRPVAQLPGRPERTWRWIRRNPLPTTLVALLMLAVAGTLWQTFEERRISARDHARVLAAEAFEVLPSDPRRAEALGLQAHELAPDVLESLTVIEAARAAEREEFVFEGHTQPVTDLEFSADGELLLSASLDGTARIWTLRTGTFVPLTHGGDGPALARFQPGGELLVTAGRSDGRLCAWNARTGNPVWTHPCGSAGHAVRVVCWSPDGKWLLTGGVGGARLWATDGTFRELVTTPGAVTAAVWLAPDQVAVGSGPISAGDPIGSHWLRTFRLGRETVDEDETPCAEGVVSIHVRTRVPDRAIVVGSSGSAHLWRRSAKDLVPLHSPHNRAINGAGWDARGDRGFTIASGGGMAVWTREGTLQRANVQTLSSAIGFLPHPRHNFAAVSGGFGAVQLRSFEGAGALLLSRGRMRALPIAFSDDGQWLAACGWDNSIHVWAMWRPRYPVFLQGGQIRTAVWTPSGRSVVIASDRAWTNQIGSALRTWDVATGHVADRHLDLDAPVTKLVWDTAQERLVCLYGMWNTGGVRVVSGVDGDLGQAGAAPPALTRLPWDGQVLDNGLVVVCQEEGILLCDLTTGAVVQRWRVVPPEPGPTEGSQRALCASPDGSTVWCGGSSGFLHRFDRRPDGSYAEAPPRQFGEAIRALEHLDDGSLLVGQCNGVLQRLMPDDNTLIPFPGHRGDVMDVDWTRASGELCIASADFAGSVRLWRDDGTLIREIRAHANIVWSVRFSPQGDRVLTGSADGTARIWPVTLDLGR